MRRLLIASTLALAGCSAPSDTSPGAEPKAAALLTTSVPTWAEDVAPILFANCADCHHGGGIAPFPLLTYADARKRARQIAVVTESRYMPPWPPERGEHSFLGQRGLDERDRDTLRRWHEGGALEGDPQQAPAQPVPKSGWQLGEPDLVLHMPDAFTVPAEGLDVFRNFVIPVPAGERRYVRAVEILPGNARVVHHAILQVDPDKLCRRLDAEDDVTGFSGMELGDSKPPEGHFIGWTPGRVPVELPNDMAWPLEAGGDLVLQLHLVPTGKPESVRSSIGLHLTEEPPTRRPYVLLLRNDDIDIAPGEDSFTIEDEFLLPVPVKVLAFYPHAHYLGKTLSTLAREPGGEERVLLHIPDWDFNWQDEYRLVAGLPLSAGTTLVMRHTYDNSEENLRNPFDPPRRVRFGQQSTDEMGTLTVQVLTATSEDRDKLEEAWLRRGVARYESAWSAHHHLADLLRRQGRLAEATTHYRRAVEIHPSHARGWHDLGAVLGETGDLPGAMRALERAVQEDPGLAPAHLARAVLLRREGRMPESVAALQLAIHADPNVAAAHIQLGRTLASLGLFERALPSLRRALELSPGSAEAHHELAGALAAVGDLDGALEREESALRLRPDYAEALAGAARILAFHPDETERDATRAVELATRAVTLTSSQDPLVLDAQAAALAAAGQGAAALEASALAVTLAKSSGNPALVSHLQARQRAVARAVAK